MSLASHIHSFSMPVRFQKGMALIFVVFSISLALLVYVFQVSNLNNLQVEQDVQTLKTLSEAKTALLAWSVNHPSLPGLMPYPDRNNDPGGYDGLSDCPGGATAYSHLIGELPWKGGDYDDCTNLLNSLGKEFKDASGEHLWYAVSKNLVHIYSPSGDPVVNPSIIDTPPYGAWLSVYDKTGQLISDRVAAVIFAPGPPLNDQDRSSGVADATNYLDTFNLQSGGGAKSNRTYSSADEDFYMGEDSRNVRTDNTVYQQPYYFNDKLVYITIDELMEELEKRAVGEARKALQNYYESQGYFPHPTNLGVINNNYTCGSSSTYGLLPVVVNNTATSCSCTWGATRTCTCAFGSAASTISFKRSSSTFSATNVSGSCSRSSSSTSTCDCTGAGYCKNTAGTQTFTCNATGTCTSTTAGTYTFTGNFNYEGSHATCGKTACNSATCTVSGTSTVSATSTNFGYNPCGDAAFNNAATNSVLPAWFTGNSWQDYIYYEISSNCTYANHASCMSATPQITVGSKTGVRSLLISAGPLLSSQSSRTTSCSITDYLDSTENTNNNAVFDATNTPRNSSYNDQMFIVAP